MRKLNRKDALMRNDFAKRELKLKITKGVIKNLNLPINMRWKNLDFNNENKNFKTRINSWCLATNSKQVLNKKWKTKFDMPDVQPSWI